MENPTQPKSEATTATHNPTDREAYSLIRSLISEGHETNHERSKFAHDPDELEAVENESKALDDLNAWLNAKEAKGDKPDLSGVPTDALLTELYRRRGEVALLSVTPQDLAEYFESDESGATNPGSQMPDAEAWKAARKAFDRWLDGGSASDALNVMRDAWNESDEEKKGGSR